MVVVELEELLDGIAGYVEVNIVLAVAAEAEETDAE